MRIGAVFPQGEIGNDPAAIRELAQGVEALGYTHLTAGEHVLGADPARRQPPLTGVNTHEHAFHEPFVLFAFVAAATETIELATSVLVLPQRQAPVVAKQAAELDLLSGGRFRLGIGLGWNHVEFEALGVEFGGRGHRAEEQIEVMRALWSEPLVDFRGRFHRIDRAGILPRPTRSIPIWFGARTEVAFRRAARLGDGVLFAGVTVADVLLQVETVRRLVAEAGRDERGFGLEAMVGGGDGPDDWRAEAAAYRDAGLTHLAVRTGGLGFTSPADHLNRLAAYRDATGEIFT